MNKHKGIVIDALFLCPVFCPFLCPSLCRFSAFSTFFMLKAIDLWLRKTPRRSYRKATIAITSKGKGKSGGCRAITLNIVERNGCLYLHNAYDNNIRYSMLKE